MNPFRRLWSWWSARRMHAAYQLVIRDALSKLKAGDPAAAAALASVPSPQPTAPQASQPAIPFHLSDRAMGTKKCACKVCAGKMKPEDLLRLEPKAAKAIDQAMALISSGATTMAYLPVQRLGWAGVSEAHILVASPEFFAQHLRPALTAAGMP